jgi:polysaccharide biosynthesis/export protein
LFIRSHDTPPVARLLVGTHRAVLTVYNESVNRLLFAKYRDRMAKQLGCSLDFRISAQTVTARMSDGITEGRGTNSMIARSVRPCFSTRRHHGNFLFAGLVLLLTACSPEPSLVGRNVPATPEYVIGPGDSLNIFVYRAPELSAEVPVRPDGRISTPLVPDIVAMGKTPSELAADIQARLKKFVKEPNVTVMVVNFVGPSDRQIRVIGEVSQPLAIPYKAQLSLLDVMIAAKGLTRFADGNRAVIVRQEPSGAKRFGVRLDDLLTYGDLSQNVAMKPGDTLFVPQAWF